MLGYARASSGFKLKTSALRALALVALALAGWASPAAASSISSSLASNPNLIEYPVKGDQVRNVANGPNDTLWFTETGAPSVGRIDLATGIVQQFDLGDPASTSFGITEGPDGNMWFTDPSCDKVGRITPAGAITESPLPGSGSCGKASLLPAGITSGPNHQIWLTEYGADTIVSFDPSHSVGTDSAIQLSEVVPLGQSGSAVSVGISSVSPVHGPLELAVTPGPDGKLVDGTVWFTEYLASEIGAIDTRPDAALSSQQLPSTEQVLSGSSQTLQPYALEQLPTPTANSGPYGITVGPDSRIWFTEENADRIGVIASDPFAAVDNNLPGVQNSPQQGDVVPGTGCAPDQTCIVPPEVTASTCAGSGSTATSNCVTDPQTCVLVDTSGSPSATQSCVDTGSTPPATCVDTSHTLPSASDCATAPQPVCISASSIIGLLGGSVFGVLGNVLHEVSQQSCASEQVTVPPQHPFVPSVSTGTLTSPTGSAITEIPLTTAPPSAAVPALPPVSGVTMTDPVAALPTDMDCGAAATLCPTGIAAASSGVPQGYAGTLLFTEQRKNALAYMPTSATVTSPSVTTIGSHLSEGAEPAGIAVGADGDVWLGEFGNTSGTNGLGELKLRAPQLTINTVGAAGQTSDTAPQLSGTFGIAPGDARKVSVTITPQSAGCTPSLTLAATTSISGRNATWQVPEGSYGPLADCAYTIAANQSDGAGNATTASESLSVGAPVVAQNRPTNANSGSPPVRLDSTPAHVSVHATSLRLASGDVVPVTLTCAARGGCVGRVVLDTTVSGRLAAIGLGLRVRSAGALAHLRNKTIRLGVASFWLSGSRTQLVRIRLTPAGRRLAAAVSRLAVRVTMTARDQAGRTTVTVQRFVMLTKRL